jgi:hypothetical protein
MATANRIEGPLTQEVMEALNRAQDIANEVRHRLYMLRDRLTGSPPEAQGGAPAKGSEAPHFKAAHSDRSAALLATLSDIDQISADLNNRI